MTDTSSTPLATQHGLERFKTALADLPGWQKGLLIASVLLIVLGLGLWTFESGSQKAGQQSTQEGSEAPMDPSAKDQTSLLPTQPRTSPGSGQPTSQEATAQEAEEAWSPVFLKLGFGFFVGFSMGFALRVFLSMALAFSGFFCIGLFALGQAGLVTVEWEAMGSIFDTFAARVGEQFENLHAFLSGALPSAGLGTFGLYAGLRRK